jgi:hypothetical protein
MQAGKAWYSPVHVAGHIVTAVSENQKQQDFMSS